MTIPKYLIILVVAGFAAFLVACQSSPSAPADPEISEPVLVSVVAGEEDLPPPAVAGNVVLVTAIPGEETVTTPPPPGVVKPVEDLGEEPSAASPPVTEYPVPDFPLSTVPSAVPTPASLQHDSTGDADSGVEEFVFAEFLESLDAADRACVSGSLEEGDIARMSIGGEDEVSLGDMVAMLDCLSLEKRDLLLQQMHPLLFDNMPEASNSTEFRYCLVRLLVPLEEMEDDENFPLSGDPGTVAGADFTELIDNLFTALSATAILCAALHEPVLLESGELAVRVYTPEEVAAVTCISSKLGDLSDLVREVLVDMEGAAARFSAAGHACRSEGVVVPDSFLSLGFVRDDLASMELDDGS